MRAALSESQLEGYRDDGVIFPIPVLSSAEIEHFRAAIEELESELGHVLKRIDNCHLHFPWAHELATRPAVLDVMEDLLGPDLFIHSTRIFCKPPGDPAFVSWHQDGTYSALNAKPAPSAWIALTDSTPESGCVRVIPGSHRDRKLPHTETYAENNLLNHGEVVDVEVDERQALDLVLEPGEMSLHHIDLIHGSEPNRSAVKRLGFAISFITPEVKTSAIPVQRARGTSDDHDFELAEPPGPRSTSEALALLRDFVRERGLQAAK